MDIAWCAEACNLRNGTLFVATAPYRQQVALGLLPPGSIVVHEGAAELQDLSGNRLTLAFISLRGPVLACVELKPPAAGVEFRSVLLTCGFTPPASAQYLRAVAALSAAAQPLEAGFIALQGVSAEFEERFFRAVPRGPLPLSDFLPALARIAQELDSGTCSEGPVP